MSADAGVGARLDFEGEPIIGRTQLTEEDFRAIWPVLPQNRRLFVRVGLWAVLIPVFWLVFTLLNTGGSSEPVHVGWVAVVLPPIFVTALVFAIWRGRVAWARNAVSDLRGAEGVEFRFDAAGFSMQAPGRQSAHAWSTLHRCIETPQAFAIYVSPVMMMVVPKRAFAADDQVRLQARLLQYVPNRPLRGADVGRSFKRMALLWVVLVIAFLVIWQVLSSK